MQGYIIHSKWHKLNPYYIVFAVYILKKSWQLKTFLRLFQTVSFSFPFLTDLHSSALHFFLFIPPLIHSTGVLPRPQCRSHVLPLPSRRFTLPGPLRDASPLLHSAMTAKWGPAAEKWHLLPRCGDWRFPSFRLSPAHSVSRPPSARDGWTMQPREQLRS